MTKTEVTAAQRRIPRATNQDTAGSRPTARNIPSAISSSAVAATLISQMAPTVTATPAVAATPMKNGDCQSNGRPGGPSGCVGVLIRAAACSAAAIGPSMASSCGWPMRAWCPDEVVAAAAVPARHLSAGRSGSPVVSG